MLQPFLGDQRTYEYQFTTEASGSNNFFEVIVRAVRQDGEVSTFSASTLGKYVPPAEEEESNGVTYKAEADNTIILVIIIVVIVLVLVIGVVASLAFLKRTRKIKLERKRSSVQRKNSVIIQKNEEFERQQSLKRQRT
jgi:hypothetical protein